MLVATEGTVTVGFAAVGPSDEEDAAPGEAAVAWPRCWSSRAGAGAGTAAGCWPPRSTTCAPDGMDRLVAWVPDGDRASAAFYEAAGWERDGLVRTLEADGGTVREERWHAGLAE